MKKMHLFLVTSLMLIASLAFSDESPIPELEKTANQIIAELKANQSKLKKDHHIVYRAVSRYLLPQVDTQGMARSVLGRQTWNAATLIERNEFTEEFTQLVIRTYAAPISEYTDEKIRFLPLRVPINGRFAQVNSVIIRSNGQNIPLSYSLVSKSGSWKVYDLSVEGVSLLQSFRSQFSEALQGRSLSHLIGQMKKKNRQG